MLLRLLVLTGAVWQVVASAYLSIGTFETTERALPVFIQPAGWAFSVWGVIYALSFVYAVYQIVPKNDNVLLRQTRIPAIVAFFGSTLWLYFAGADNWQLWLTAPTLFLIAFMLAKITSLPDDTDDKVTFFSKTTLYPYAAWTGIACWLNVQTLLIEESVVTTDGTNLLTNAVLFVAIATYSLWVFKRTGYSELYGAVIAWASVGVIAVNGSNTPGLWFSVAAGSLLVLTIGLYVRQCFAAKATQPKSDQTA